jgi:hypothetical protein
MCKQNQGKSKKYQTIYNITRIIQYLDHKVIKENGGKCPCDREELHGGKVCN